MQVIPFRMTFYKQIMQSQKENGQNFRKQKRDMYWQETIMIESSIKQTKKRIAQCCLQDLKLTSSEGKTHMLRDNLLTL